MQLNIRIMISMLNHASDRLASLLVVCNIYNVDELLLKYDHNVDGNRYNVDQKDPIILMGNPSIKPKGL